MCVEEHTVFSLGCSGSLTRAGSHLAPSGGVGRDGAEHQLEGRGQEKSGHESTRGRGVQEVLKYCSSCCSSSTLWVPAGRMSLHLCLPGLLQPVLLFLLLLLCPPYFSYSSSSSSSSSVLSFLSPPPPPFPPPSPLGAGSVGVSHIHSTKLYYGLVFFFFSSLPRSSAISPNQMDSVTMSVICWAA